MLGHEFSAVVNDERGEEFGLPPGTLVAVDPAEPCDRCEWCMHGYTNLCPNVRFAGTAPVPGALREFYHARPQSSIRCRRALMTWMELCSSPSVSRCTP